MHEPASPLVAWATFYVIVGPSAVGLAGLQFVVLALGTEIKPMRLPTVRAFGSPTIVHLCASLLVSAIMCVPWPALSSAGLGLGICGALGCAYTVAVIRHAREQTEYRLSLQDWLWLVALPFVTYGALLAAGIALDRHPDLSLFVIAATALLLLLIGVRNAWAAVTHIAVERASRRWRGAAGGESES